MVAYKKMAALAKNKSIYQDFVPNPSAMGGEENQERKENIAGVDDEDEEDKQGAPPAVPAPAKEGGDEKKGELWLSAPAATFAGLNAAVPAIVVSSDNLATPPVGGVESPHYVFPSHQHQNISPTTTTSRTDFNNAGEEEKDNQKEQDQHFHSTFFGEQSGGNEANTVDGMITRNTASNTPEFHPASPPTHIPSIVATPCFSSTSSSSRFLHDRISRKRRRTPPKDKMQLFCLPSRNTSPRSIRMGWWKNIE